MASNFPQRPDSETLWEAAVQELTEEDRNNVNFNQHKGEALNELYELIGQQQEKCKNKRWKFKGFKGKIIIMRDILAKWVKWLDHYKIIGDVAIQVYPGVAALPWAGFRFILQVAVNETEAFEFFAERFTLISEIICRSAIHDKLCTMAQTPSVPELKRSLTLLYKNILLFLGRVRKYYADNTLKRMFKAGTLEYTSVKAHFDDIIAAEQRNYALSQQVMSENNTERLMEIKNQLNSINAPLVRWDSTLEKFNDSLNKEKRDQILDWVSTEPYMRYHTQTKRGVIKNTGSWLVDHPAYKTWRNESSSSLFWLHGIPGSGKSKLVSIAVDYFHDEFQNKTCPQPVYFYCNRNPLEPARSDPTSILACLAVQLCCIQPGEPLLDPIITEYDKHPRSKSLIDVLEAEAIRRLIIDLINKYPTVTIIIDALDEVNTHTRSEFIQNLKTILEESASLVKIFVSSRDDQDIVHQLQGHSNLEIKDGNFGDIEEFTRLEVNQHVETRPWLFKNLDPCWIIRRLTEKANGMFLWVDLQLRNLSKLKTPKAVEQRLGELSPELKDIYEEVLKRIENCPESIDHEYAQITFSLLLCARRKIGINEFLELVAWYPPLRKGENVGLVAKEEILDICCNLIAFDSDTDSFRFAHLSVREFLESKDSYSTKRSNSVIAQACLRRLNRMPSTHTREYSRWFKYEYHVCWAHHCRDAGPFQRSQGHLKILLTEFFTKSFNGVSPYFYFCKAFENDIDHCPPLIGVAEVYLDFLQACVFDSSEPYSILFTACAFDLCEIVREHITKGRVDPNVKNKGETSLLQLALRRRCNETVKILVGNACIKVTEAEVEAALCRDWSRELIALLLRKSKVTHHVAARMAAAYATADMMDMLLQDEIKDVKITRGVMTSAVRNERDGEEMVKLLVAKGVCEVWLTEKLILAAAKNYRYNVKIMTFLLTGQYVNVKMTEATVPSVIRYYRVGVVSLLLARIGDSLEITEELMRSAARNQHGEVLQILFDKKRHISLTSEIFIEAIRGGNMGNLKWLLETADNRSVSEDMLVEAAGNPWAGVDQLKLLLEKDEKASITERVMLELVKSQYAWDLPKISAVRDDIPVTEEILLAAAASDRGSIKLKFLLEKQDDDTCITGRVLLQIFRSGRYGALCAITGRWGYPMLKERLVPEIMTHLDPSERAEIAQKLDENVQREKQEEEEANIMLGTLENRPLCTPHSGSSRNANERSQTETTASQGGAKA